MGNDYKSKVPFDLRKQESERIKDQYPDRLPVVVEKNPICKSLPDIDKKFVVVSALDGDFQREPFPQISQLYPLADKITKLNAICLRCSNKGIQNDASFSLRTVKNMDKHFVGGKDSYEAVCRYHYLDGIDM